jgi:integrase
MNLRVPSKLNPSGFPLTKSGKPRKEYRCGRQRFAPEWIRDGLIVFRMQKPGGKAVVPIRPMIYQIMGRWNAKAPRMCQQKFNDALKDLLLNLEINRPVVLSTYRAARISQVTVPLHEAVTSHTARRTFISLCLLNGIANPDVMKVSGHSD